MIDPTHRGRACAAVVLAIVLCTLASGCGAYRWQAPPSATVTQTTTTHAAGPSTDAPSSATATPSPSPTPSTTSPAQIRAEVDRHVAALTAGQPKDAVSIAAVNTRTGARYDYGPRGGMWTASVYKLLVLEALLLQRGGLSGGELATATRMIENSDNAAGYQLFLAAGGNSGLAAAARRLGMKHTVIGRSDPTFTTTGASGCLQMLRALVRPGPLNAQSRALALRLMRNVEADQRWGVGAIADRGTTFANKNGWLSVDNSNGPGESDNGRWVVNSVGIVTVGGDQMLMAVMTQHQRSFDAGVALVRRLARAVAPAVR
jgi:beta-lactamase class A